MHIKWQTCEAPMNQRQQRKFQVYPFDLLYIIEMIQIQFMITYLHTKSLQMNVFIAQPRIRKCRQFVVVLKTWF